MRKAEVNLQLLDPTTKCKIDISDFVLLKAPKNAKVPFWIAQVVGKDTIDGVQKVKLRYWKLLDGMRDAYNDDDEYELEVGAKEIWAYV